MDSVLERAKPSEISTILPHIADIFSCLRKMSTFSVECSKLCHHLTPDILSCLKRQIASIDGPMDIYVDNLHVLMADIVMVTFMINNDSGVSPAMLNLWGYFASEGRVDVRIRCRFLISILGEPNIRSALHEEHTASHGNNGRSILNDAALQGWMKCNLMSCVIGNNMMETLHSYIAQLELVRLVVGDITEKFTFHLFLEALADKHRKSQNFLERVRWSSMSTRWFSSVVDSAIHEMRSTEPNIVSSIYHTTGDIVLHCCHMLFTPGKPCPVSKLLDNIVAVQYLPESSCATSTHALRTSIHKFILGGLKVGLNVSYIKRTLKQILLYFINKWPISDEKNTNHPFLQVLHHPTATTTMQDDMLGLLLESSDDNQNDKLAMVLQILHIWWNSEERKVAQYPVLRKYPPFLQQARVKLRFNQVFVGKATDLLQTFRQLTQ
uniref:MMS22-like C-terminal domain-containing protein n=1 Tax=Ciona savignyi TaxID=51511 RepID=H2YD56_CIOSA